MLRGVHDPNSGRESEKKGVETELDRYVNGHNWKNSHGGAQVVGRVGDRTSCIGLGKTISKVNDVISMSGTDYHHCGSFNGSAT